MSDSYHAIGQVCLNGHAITGDVSFSDLLSKHCPTCGEATTNKCAKCNANLRGYYYVPGVISAREYEPPAYCHSCGAPFPWTERRLKAAADLIEESELSADEKALLAQSVQQLATDTPQTEVAIVRYKRLIQKAGPGIGNALKQVTVAVATEAVKKALWPTT
jgi:hypothetical protein